MSSVHDDLLHHGEIRGVEVKMLDITVNELDSTTLEISLELELPMIHRHYKRNWFLHQA